MVGHVVSGNVVVGKGYGGGGGAVPLLVHAVGRDGQQHGRDVRRGGGLRQRVVTRLRAADGQPRHRHRDILGRVLRGERAHRSAGPQRDRVAREHAHQARRHALERCGGAPIIGLVGRRDARNR